MSIPLENAVSYTGLIKKILNNLGLLLDDTKCKNAMTTALINCCLLEAAEIIFYMQ